VSELPERWKAVAFAGVVLASVTALFFAGAALYPAPGFFEVRSVSLRVEGPGWTISYGAGTTANATAFGLLLEASDRLGFDVAFIRYAPLLDSVLVEAINGTASGSGGLWWLYWVDGRYGEVGADRSVLRDDSVVLWAFRTYPPEA